MDVSGGLSLVQTVMQLLSSPIWTKIEAMLGVDSQLEKLKDTISTVETVLLDAEVEDRQHHFRRSYAECNRLQRLKEALFRADDLFDEIATTAQQKKLISSSSSSSSRFKKEVILFFSRSNPLSSAYKWCQEIENILETLDDIVKDHRHNFTQRHPVGLEAWPMKEYPREEIYFLCEEKGMIGRDEDKQKVMDMLFDSSVVENVSFISIVGIGGLGKTTLAQYVYNDADIETAFDLKIWICVSEDFDVERLRNTIFAAAKSKTKRQGDTQTQMNSRGELDGKKYLLVLDDVWNEDYGKWQHMRPWLEIGSRGSKVLITTRSKRVASAAGSHKMYELAGLLEKDAWNLFERIAFEGGQHQMESHFIDIGKEVVRKCANVPLAIKVVASLLRGQDLSKWQYFKDTDLANITQDDDNGILSVLKTSYHHLPFHLKSCFSFCATFPKDYKIMKGDLIRLWMAQGFIMPIKGQSPEFIGEEYFMNLVQRCFFQDLEKAHTGKIISCKMHDLIHDLATEVATGTNILSNNSTGRFNEKTRHLFIDYTFKTDFTHVIIQMKRMRTLLINNRDENINYTTHENSPLYQKSRVLLPKVRYLRVLDLHGSGVKKVPSMIGKLLHLRYLDLSRNLFSVLPASIAKLLNLQTLKLHGCWELKSLPRDLSKLVNLRDLEIHDCWSLRHMPPGMNRMTSLQKLTGFVVSETNNAKNRGFGGVGDLGDLNEFTNHSDVVYISVREAGRYNKIKCTEWAYLLSKHLIEIDIRWYSDDSDEGGSIEAPALMQHLSLCPNVTKLYVCDYPGVSLASGGESTINFKVSFLNLAKIELHGCKRLEYLISMSKLNHLKVLRLLMLNKLEYMESCNIDEDEGTSGSGNDVVFFPSLEILELYDLPSLKGLWKSSTTESREGEKEARHEDDLSNNNEQRRHHQHLYQFPRLSKFRIKDCDKLTSYIVRPKKEVVIDNQGCVNSPAMESFQHLSTLFISGNSNIERLTRVELFQSGYLSSLRSLTIDFCSKLKTLSEQGVWEQLTTLETLQLQYLDELDLDEEDDNDVNTPGGRRDGEMKDDEAIASNTTTSYTPWRCIGHTLRSLELKKLPKLVKLPKEMRHLTSLHSLEIIGCDNLKELPTWIGCLSSLRSLGIHGCRRIVSLPEEMRELSTLSQLRMVYISEELEKRCRRDEGVDWPKIKHIPNIRMVN